MRILKKILLALLVLFILIQFYPRPHKNESGYAENEISKIHFVPSDVNSLLQNSCYDCHSNKTNYPWYFNIQPVAWWLGDHIEQGKKDLNFSEFASYSARKRFKKLEEINELVKEGEMPLESYTIIHTKAKLSNTDKIKISEWATNLQDSMKASYPADSLLRKQ